MHTERMVFTEISKNLSTNTDTDTDLKIIFFEK